MANMAMLDSAITYMINNGKFNMSMSRHKIETHMLIIKLLSFVSEDMTISM
jgi:hypothetical protein